MPEFQFDSIGEFLAMGGYAFYVWLAYLVFFVVMGANVILPLLGRRKVLRLLQARQRREQAGAAPDRAGEMN